MIHERLYSFDGQVLKRADKSFIIVIWSDIPFFVALPEEYTSFMEKVTVKEFERSSIQKFIEEPNSRCVFDYLVENGIISNRPYTVEPKAFVGDPRPLYYISLQATERCNLKCKHCYAHGGEISYNVDLSTTQVMDIVQKASEFADRRRCNFIITGGEPFMRPDILDIINFTKDRFENVVVVTNGLLLSDEKIDFLKKIQGLALQVSLDGATEKTHEYIRGKGTYRRLIDNIRSLVESKVKIALSPVCTEMFFNEIDEYFELAKELNVHTVQLQPVQYIGRALTDSNITRVNGAALIQKIVKYYFDEGLNNLIRNGLESRSIIHVRNLNRLINCGTGNGTMYIKANGDIFSCPNMVHNEFRVGNALEQDIRELYHNSPIYRRLRSLDVDIDFDPDCKKCEVKHFCGGGCRGVCLANTGSIYGKAIECDSLKSYFNEILWAVCEHRDFFKLESHKWLEEKRVQNEILG